jgi:CTP:molybdopterin cytidylyltransferase MocA
MPRPGRAAAVILAAGLSTRFGPPKQLAAVGRRTLLQRVVDVADASGLDPILAVVPPGITPPSRAKAVLNDAPAEGISRSLRLGLAAVPAGVGGAVILLGDQPTVTVAAIDTLVVTEGAYDVIATAAGGRSGPPVWLVRNAFGLADEAEGDRGLAAILRRHADRVGFAEGDRHAPDVDTLDDLAALGEPCPGCDGLFAPASDGPTHPYIGSSAACWSAFGAVLAREFQDPAYGWSHRHAVDAYAAQHPGTDGPRQRQSVGVHLIGLCHWLEHGLDAASLTKVSQRLTAPPVEWPWLEPPRSYAMSVADVLGARDAAAHGRLVRRWAECVWAAWSAHHCVVRRWAQAALDGSVPRLVVPTDVRPAD